MQKHHINDYCFQTGRLYAAKYDQGECEWHRVEVMDVHGVWITCFFVDLGVKEAMTVDKLKELDAKFLKVPAQAVSVSLFGLEAFGDSPSALSQIQTELEGKTFVAQVRKRPEAKDKSLALVIMDTSTDEDINMVSVFVRRNARLSCNLGNKFNLISE